MQGHLNPFIEAGADQRQEVRALNIVRHRILVEALYDEEFPKASPEYERVANVCKSVFVEHDLRPFMRGVFEDREIVKKLPAFHILFDREWEMTVYTAEELGTGLYTIAMRPKRISTKSRISWSSWFSGLLPRPQTRRRFGVVGSEGL